VRRVGLSPNVRKKQLAVKPKVFGVPLQQLIASANNSEGVPDVVFQCTTFLRAHGLTEEGIFRIGGNRRLIDHLKNEFDSFGHTKLNHNHEVSVIASLFKMFFRELPDPLVSNEVSKEILLYADQRSLTPVQLAGEIQSAVKGLSKPNKTTLKYLCDFLAEVGQHEEQTKMADSSLAIVFGPNVFRIQNDLEALQRQPAITRAMSCLITHSAKIFGPMNEVVKPDKNIIRVEAVNTNNTTCFVMPEQVRNKENINSNHAKISPRSSGQTDWDDSWLSSLTQDSPSPETEDILARSHDSFSSMSPLTGSGNISVQLHLQRTISECVWDMLVPVSGAREGSFAQHAPSNKNMRRTNGEPRPEYHNNRNSFVTDTSPSPSPPLVNQDRRSSDGMFNFQYLGKNQQPLPSLTKGRVSPQKRRQVSRTTKKSSESDSSPEVPLLNLSKLNKPEGKLKQGESLATISSFQSDSNIKASRESMVSLHQKTIQLKQKISAFDRSFEQQYGRTPESSERRPIAGVIKELNDLKRILADAKTVRSQSTSSGSTQNVLKNQFTAISEKMDEKRKTSGRPDSLNHMTSDQLTEEKLCIQKLLLIFEETHGRPKTKDQKDTMRPIYDRYRKVKILLNKSNSKDRIGSSEGDKTPTPSPRSPHGKERGQPLADTWNVTMGGTQSAVTGIELMTLSPDELEIKYNEFQEVKKNLRKTLRDYEKKFMEHTGRKVMKDDRGPREAEYNEYKKVKAKIRLIDTLLKRNDGSSTI